MLKDQIAPLCNTLLEDTKRAVSSVIEAIVKVSVADDRFPRLQLFLRTSIEQSAEKLFQEATTRVGDFLEAESHPYSQNHYLFENIAKKRNESLQLSLTRTIQAAAGAAVDDGEQKVSLSTVETLIKASFERNRRMSMEEHVAEEMSVILDSYGKVSAKRIIDEVPMIALTLLSRTMRKDFERYARGVVDSKLKELMVERGDIQSKRSKAKEQLLAMEKAQEVFNEISVEVVGV